MKIKHLVGGLLVIMLVLAIRTFSQTLDTRVADLQASKPVVKEQDFILLSRIGGSQGGVALNQPSYAVSDNQGKVYIADSGNHRVVVCDLKGKVVTTIGTIRSVRPLVYPYGIAIINNRVIVADSGSGAVEEYNTDGEHIKTWVQPRENIKPGMLSLNPDGRVFIGDLQGKQILIFSKEGRLEKKVRPQKIALGIPHGLANTGDGRLWVVDGENSNIKLLDSQGEFVSLLDGAAKLSTPKGLAQDSSGRMFISDVLSNTVRIFDKSGKDVGLLKESSGEQFTLPLGISVDNSDRILVADQGGNNIQIWGHRR